MGILESCLEAKDSKGEAMKEMMSSKRKEKEAISNDEEINVTLIGECILIGIYSWEKQSLL